MSHTREALESDLKGFSGALLWDEPLSKHTYYRIGGPASLLAIPKEWADLALLGNAVRRVKLPYFVLGQGSNLLASDRGYSGVVIKASRLNLDMIESSTDRLRLGASVAISSFLRKAAECGWGGLEFWTGVPGSVGGAIAMNAGTHLGETKDAIVSVGVYLFETGELVNFEGDQLKFEYRKNLFLPEGGIILYADFKFKKEDPAVVKARIQEVQDRRKATQPVDYPSCGSVFKNPKAHGLNAWQVVEKLGLRGHKIGNAQISEKHPNFIINLGEAKASEVKALIKLIKTRAQAELGIALEEEVKFLGQFSDG